MDHKAAVKLLKSVTMHNITEAPTPNGVMWSGVLKIEGVPTIRVTQRGNGGPNEYSPIRGVEYKIVRDALRDLEAASTLINRETFEAFDLVTACMGEGGNAFDAAVTSIGI